MNQIASKPLKIKKVGGSWDIRLPFSFGPANNLREGDYVVIGNLKILRAEDFEKLVQEPGVEAAE
jgi:hypothetical protein